jgi:hypothetical protein
MEEKPLLHMPLTRPPSFGYEKSERSHERSHYSTPGTSSDGWRLEDTVSVPSPYAPERSGPLRRESPVSRRQAEVFSAGPRRESYTARESRPREQSDSYREKARAPSSRGRKNSLSSQPQKFDSFSPYPPAGYSTNNFVEDRC